MRAPTCKGQTEECAKEVQHFREVYDQRLQKHTEFEEHFKKLQQEKAKDEGRAIDEDVILVKREEEEDIRDVKQQEMREVIEDTEGNGQMQPIHKVCCHRMRWREDAQMQWDEREWQHDVDRILEERMRNAMLHVPKPANAQGVGQCREARNRRVEEANLKLRTCSDIWKRDAAV